MPEAPVFLGDFVVLCVECLPDSVPMFLGASADGDVFAAVDDAHDFCEHWETVGPIVPQLYVAMLDGFPRVPRGSLVTLTGQPSGYRFQAMPVGEFRRLWEAQHNDSL